MQNNILSKLFTPPSEYDKKKVCVLKAILPIIIIIHHIHNFGYLGLEGFGGMGNIAMYFFFAMSGYGLTISYLKNIQYLKGFLQRSLLKLFIPYIIALIAFVVYRYFEGIDQVILFKEKGLFSLVPTSWFVWVLSYFYIFFFVVFRYVKSDNIVKVLLVCSLVVGYILLARHIGIESHQYNRCPAFCVGMMFAFYDGKIRSKFSRLNVLIGLFVFVAIMAYVGRQFDSILCPSVLFLLMYLITDIREFRIVKFLSSISMEMFIIQFLPIYIAVDDLRLSSTFGVVMFVLMLDIMLAYTMHVFIKRM